MRYMGSKRRIAKHLVPIISAHRKKGQTYVEPFAGGMNMMENFRGERIANDLNHYVIACFKALQGGWIPPKFVSEDEYKDIKNNKDKYDDFLVGYVGVNSFGGKWFGGYPRQSISKGDWWKQCLNNIMTQAPKLKGTKFTTGSYETIQIPKNSVIYCDPPYKGTTGYLSKINHAIFWQWVRDRVAEGHTVFVSEYEAPEDFKTIWCQSLRNELNESKAKECLFVHESQAVTKTTLF